MNVRRLLFPMIVIWCINGTIGYSLDEVRNEVEAILDEWKDRVTARQHLIRLGDEAQPMLQLIAITENQPELRRRRAIYLLGTLSNSESIKTLAHISNADPPCFRCFAMHAMAEIRTEDVLDNFIKKLDDKDICMYRVYSDPHEEEDVLVCDEAIRLLEKITGLSLGTGKDRAEKIRIWKAWWNSRLDRTKTR